MSDPAIWLLQRPLFERQTGQSLQCHPQRIREWHPQLPAGDLSGMNLAKLSNRDAVRVLVVITSWQNTFSKSLLLSFPVLYLHLTLSRVTLDVASWETSSTWCAWSTSWTNNSWTDGPWPVMSLQMHTGSGFQSLKALPLTIVLKCLAR